MFTNLAIYGAPQGYSINMSLRSSLPQAGAPPVTCSFWMSLIFCQLDASRSLTKWSSLDMNVNTHCQNSKPRILYISKFPKYHESSTSSAHGAQPRPDHHRSFPTALVEILPVSSWAFRHGFGRMARAVMLIHVDPCWFHGRWYSMYSIYVQ